MNDLIIGKKNVSSILRDRYTKLKKEGWVSLVHVPSEKHMAMNTASLQILINELGYDCIYIALGKTASQLSRDYRKVGIDTNKLYFIDAISKMYGEAKSDTKKIIYTSGPLDIDSITTSLNQFLASLNNNKVCVFLDSVSTVLLYNSLPRTIRFSQFITTTLKKVGVTGVMVTVAKGESTKKLIQELEKLCDEVLDITN
jgi:KaiC/GvpD/RAD55 family RecA-like ATPase